MQRRLVFSINSGRSGSEYLTELLGTAANAVAFHEPQPTMTGDVLRAVMEHGPAASLAARRTIKAPAIRDALAAEPDAVYVETSHMFVKTFHDVVDEAFADADVRVVVLRRDLARTLRSFVRMGYFTPAGGPWRDWMHDAWAPGALEVPPLPSAEATPVDRCIAYLLDIEARAQRYLRTNPDRCVEVRLEELQDEDGVRPLFTALGLEWTDATSEAVGRRVNARSARKDELGITYTVDDATRDLEAYLARYDAAGRARPDLPTFTPPPPGATAPTTVPTAAPSSGPHGDRRGMRIVHLVNPVAAGPSSDLHVAQPVTFEAMRRARAFAETLGHEVELVATTTNEERHAVPDDFTFVGPLTRTAMDVTKLRPARPLPFLQDLLDGLKAFPGADLYIYTNVDIAPLPGFYDALATMHASGLDAMVVNRRTIEPDRTDVAAIPMLEALPGEQHPGHDCFAFTERILELIDVGRVVVGVNWVGRALMWNLAHHAEHFREHLDLHLTYHIGDDRVWLDPAMEQWRSFNMLAATEVLERLVGDQTALDDDAPIRWYLRELGVDAPRTRPDQGPLLGLPAVARPEPVATAEAPPTTEATPPRASAADGTTVPTPAEREAWAELVEADGFWFVDVPRTGSTSLRVELGRRYGPQHGKRNADDDLGTEQLVPDHLTARVVRRWLGPDRWDQLYTFTIVRDPWTRTASMWRWRASRGQLPEDCTLPRYVALLAAKDPTLFRYQPHFLGCADYLTDEDGHLLVDDVVHFTERASGIARIADQLPGRPELGTVHTQRGTTDLTASWTPAAVRTIEHVYARDVELFGFTVPDDLVG